jgi:hypothetical protein
VAQNPLFTRKREKVLIGLSAAFATVGWRTAMPPPLRQDPPVFPPGGARRPARVPVSLSPAFSEYRGCTFPQEESERD